MLFQDLINLPRLTKVQAGKRIMFFIGLSKDEKFAAFCDSESDSIESHVEPTIVNWKLYVEPPVDRTIELTASVEVLNQKVASLESDKKAFRDSLDFVVAERNSLLQQKATLEAELAAEKAKNEPKAEV